MNRDNAVSRGDYLRPWEFIRENEIRGGIPQFPTLYSTYDQIPRAQLWLTAETRRARISLQLQLCVYLWRATRISSIGWNTKLRANLLYSKRWVFISYYSSLFYYYLKTYGKKKLGNIDIRWSKKSQAYPRLFSREREEGVLEKSDSSNSEDLNVNGIAFRVESSSIRVDSV